MEGASASAGAGAGGAQKGAADTAGLERLEAALLTACDTLSSLAGLAMNFTHDSQETLFSSVNDLVRDLHAIDAAAQHTPHAVPLDVLHAIDRGQNPERTTLAVLEECNQANAAALGKLAAMSLFRDELQKQVAAAGVALEDPKKALEQIDAAVKLAQESAPADTAAATASSATD